MSSLTDVLEGRGVPIRRSGKPDEIYICCPFCTERGESPDTRFRLGINVDNGWSNCFNCQWKTRDKNFLERELDRAFQTGGFELGGPNGYKQQSVEVKLPEDFRVISVKSSDRSYWEDLAYDYLKKKRRVADYQIRKHRIGISMMGPMRGRVVIPVYVDRELVGLVGRDFTGKNDPPYKNSIGERSIFNLPMVKSKMGVLVEGPYDALAVERAARNGEWDGLAVLGHSLTSKQLKQLKGYRTIILWPDYPTDEKPDDPGMNGFLGMVSDLRSLVTKDIRLVLPNMKGGPNWDPDEYSLPDRHQKIAEAKELTSILEQKIRAWAAFRKDE